MKNKNNKKIILDLCGGSGSWGKPYKDAGYDVRLITLPDLDVTKHGFFKKELNFWDSKNKYTTIKVKDIYGVLCAPPCTEFSKAKSTAPRDFEKGMETIKACLDIVWGIQVQHKLQFWVLENPEGLLSRFLGNPPYKFYQWEFGNDRNKRTHLWGRFNEPKKIHTKKPKYVHKSAHNKNADWYSNSSAAVRAITPEGFAKAFFEANK